MTPIYLASASPRRRELLNQIGVSHSVLAVDIDESHRSGEAPELYVLRLAQAKAEAAWKKLAPEQRSPVLAADTTVTIDGTILGKPQDRADALAMLARLSGREHQVLTAVALRTERDMTTRTSLSRVTFRPITVQEAERYWLTGEPHDKAGAYAIQGYAAVFIENLTGSYSGVMGLPLFETAELLVAAGVEVA